jgi:DNA repair protein RadC
MGTMGDLAPDDRPREKLDRSGVGTLGDNELLALLLGRGTKGESALSVATGVLAAAGGVHGLTRMSASRLARLPGLGAALSSRVVAGIELGRRTLTRAPRARLQFRGPADVAAFVLPQFGAAAVERFGALLLDLRLRLIKTQHISSGTLDATAAAPREVFREATIAGAAAIIVFHNHPSGDPTPSEDDVKLTLRLQDAGEVLGIDVLDHVILADTRYVSLKGENYF